MREMTSSSHTDKFIFNLQSCKSLMVKDLTLLSVIKSEVECKDVSQCNASHKQHQVGHLTMTMCIERIITKLIPVWLIMCVWLVDNQVGVRVWRENVLVTE